MPGERFRWRRSAVRLALMAAGATLASISLGSPSIADVQDSGRRAPRATPEKIPADAPDPSRSDPGRPRPDAKATKPERAREDASRSVSRRRAPSHPSDTSVESDGQKRDAPANTVVDLNLPGWARDAIGLHPVRLSLNVQTGFASYSAHPHPLVFVISRHGRYASWRYCHAGARCSVGPAARKALARCDEIGIDSPCYIFAVGRGQVWKGNIEKEDTLGASIQAAADTELRGPEAARGVVFYFRGYGAFRFPPALAYRRVPPYLHRFAGAGWDVKTVEVPYYNRPSINLPRIAALIRRTVAAARAQGYKRVLLAGQSRGAWEILTAGNGELQVDGAILMAPAAHGTRFLLNGQPNRNFAQGNPAFRRLLGNFRVPRVAFAFFRRDPFMPPTRSSIAREALSGRTDTRLFLVDRPAGLPGHNASWSAYFDKAWGPCLQNFFDGQAEARDFACAAKRVRVEDPTLIYSSDHLFEHGASPVSAEALKPLVEARKLYVRPEARHDGWWQLDRDGRITIKLEGPWVRPNPVRATWETRGNRLCVINSPVHGGRVFCYTVYKVKDEVLALVMTSQVVRLMYLR